MDVRFRIPDAVYRHPPVPAEQIVLGTYTFLPHHRTGAAAGLSERFSTGGPARATLTLRVPVTAGATTAMATTTLRLRGPGDVLTVDRRQIIRRYPEPGASNAETNDLAHVELDTPDLPWQFTPTGPDAAGNLPPWLRLIVVPAAAVVRRRPARPGLPDAVTVPKSELPPPGEAWAWAHVQVLGPVAGSPSLPARLSPATPTTNVARLLCPRKLDANVAWVAAIVPTFEAGRLAGLGQPVPDDATLAWSWGPSAADDVTLPAYDLWRFSTGDDGDFEKLAERLLPVPPPEGVGRRRVDTSNPGMGIEPAVDAASREVSGPLIRIGDPATDGRSWPAATTEALRRRVDSADEVTFSPGEPSDPTLGPPLYAGAHLARRTVPAEGTEPEWARSLNLDPADRLVAGLGTRVVQMDQEELMTSAWAQVEGVVAANAALSAAALGRFVGESLHRRHLERMAPADLVAATARSHTRIADSPERTVAARIAGSATPPAAVGPLLRRMARPTGPIARFAGASVAERVAATRALRVDDEGDARSWVRQYSEPDGVRGVEQSTLRVLLELLGSEAQAQTEALEQLYDSAFVSTLSDVAVPVGDLADGVALGAGAEELRQVLESLLAELPTTAEIEADPEAAGPLIGDLLGQALAVLEVGWAMQRDRWGLAEAVVAALELGGEPEERTGRVVVEAQDIRQALFDRWRFAKRFMDLDEPVVNDDVVEALHPLMRPGDEVLAGDLSTLRDGLAAEGPRLGDIERPTFAVAELSLLERLDPRVTAVRRIKQRLTAWPAWLPRDWFDDARMERVMVAPRFRHPMYEALDRHDRQWLLPGVGSIHPQEMVTLLETNPRFVEAFLIGLNTEMARELLWREYPTDGRATSFRSFWTRDDELLAEVHAMGAGPLGSHIDSRYGEVTVLLVRGELVRRYPDLLAHAATQVDADRQPTFSAPATTLFRLFLAPDMLVVGVAVKPKKVTDADTDLDAPARANAWWFLLSEHVGQPRFGLDDGSPPAGDVRSRDDLTWLDWRLAGSFLSAAGPTVTVGDRPRPGEDSAMLGWLLFQQPARVAFRGARMIGRMS